ncbi:MAG: CHAT domain-containing protein [Saprospiraceae bacterium]|nr:CHAT domain-containing protein [Saprospiraceae bacterium]
MKNYVVILFLLCSIYGYTQEIDTLSYDKLGVAFRAEGKMNEAIWAFGKAKEVALNGQEWQVYARAAHQQGWCYFFKAEFDSADWMLRDVLNNLDTLLHNDIERANIYYCLSAVSAKKNKNSFSLGFAQKAIDIVFDREDYKPDLAKFYNALGTAYSSKFDFQKALESHFLSVEIKKEVWGDQSNEVAKSYNNIGVIYREMGELEKALDYYTKSLNIKIEKVGEDDPGVAATYNNMAILYQDMGDLDQSIDLLLKSLAIERAIFGEKSYALVDKYGVLATVYKKKGLYQEALNYNEKCFNIWRSIFSENHDLYARTLRSSGDIYAEMGEYVTAYGYYRKSLVELLGEFGSGDKIPIPDKSLLIGKMDVLFTLSNYSDAVLNHYYNRGDKDILIKALQLYNLSSEVVDMIRTGYREEVSRLALQDNAADVYEGGITAAYELYDLTEEESYLEKAFTFSERNKSTVLQSFIIENQALEFSKIPDTVLAREQNQKQELRQLEDEINSLEDELDQSLLNQRYESKKTYEAFIDELERNYPDYHQLKYDLGFLSLDEIEDIIEDKNLGLIEFFWGEEWVYIFSISTNKKSFHRKKLTDSLISEINQFRSTISDADLAITKEKDTDQYDKYVAQSRQLYITYLEDVINPAVNTLMIIPDGLLYTVPFELLLTDDKKLNIRDYSALPYLMRKCPVRYGYSSHQLKEKKSSNEASKRLAAFSPLYDGKINSSLASRSSISALQYAREEAQVVSDKFSGDFYEGDSITKEVFKNNAPDYSVLHLAMHAFTDDNNPMYSGMIFSQEEILHAYELYNMELNADLVVLSACNTGMGKLIKGEGVMSLARAFRYAGVPNIVMSQWAADDETASKIMTLFYDHLASGLPKDKALTQAKIDYLDSNSRKVHPYFWGSFVLVGDDEGVFLSRAFSFKDYFLLGVIAFLFIAIGWSLYTYLK